MRERLARRTTRLLRTAMARGAARVAANDWVMDTLYDLMNESDFSGLSRHEEMLNDRVRVETYHDAVHRLVRPGDVVVDLGTGSGLLAFFASRAGAAKVYAVEHSDFIDVARDIARHNGIENIEFLQANSRDLSFPEPVDVILHEQMGDELFNENMIDNVVDLRNRALGSGGRILPARFRLFVEPVSMHDSFRVRRFENTTLPDGIDLAGTAATAARFDTGGFEQLWARPGSVASTVGDPEPILTFDLHDLAGADAIERHHVVGRTATSDGVVDGFCVWFEAAFDDDTTLTTSPLAPLTSWGNRMFRLDEEVVAGEPIDYSVDLTPLVEPGRWRVVRR